MPPTNAALIPYCLHQALENGTIVIHGDGKQTRDYVYVEDVVNAMVSAAVTPDINHLIINVGSGQEASVTEVVNLVLKVTGKKPEVIYHSQHDSGPSRMSADLGLARKKLNYNPRITLENGLRLTIEKDSRFMKLRKQ